MRNVSRTVLFLILALVFGLLALAFRYLPPGEGAAAEQFASLLPALAGFSVGLGGVALVLSFIFLHAGYFDHEHRHLGKVLFVCWWIILSAAVDYAFVGLLF